MKEIVLKNSSLLPVSFCCFVFGSLLVTTAGAQSPAPPQQVTNSIGMKLVQIPIGTFSMGSPATERDRADDEIQHQVTISRPFSMGCTEVTQGQWKKVMGTEPWKGKRFVLEGDDVAAGFLSWHDATAFCRKLSALEGKTYRLPTEAEWEYACRGGTKTVFSFGDDPAGLEKSAWFRGNAGSIDEKYAHGVALKLPNPFGLYDMHGNAWEWCSDWYGEYPAGPLTDPGGPESGTARVLRGGFWGNDPEFVRCARRHLDRPEGGLPTYGFRVVLQHQP
ncbi:MAG: formylglycine-generating enzyme family protein [Planctomyces sp.]